MLKNLSEAPKPSPEIEASEGYKKLKASVDHDIGQDEKRESSSRAFHDYNEKLVWALARAEHYAQKTGVSVVAILDAWEKSRDYWYMNYYQDANLPLLEGDRVRVFDAVEDLHKSVGRFGFRCPACSGVSKDAYACDTGKKVMVTKGRGKKAKLVESDKVCDWKVYGFFRDLGKGVHVFVKTEMRGQQIFMPISWEDGFDPSKATEVLPAPKPKEEAVTKPPISETSAAGFMIDDEVGYKSSLKDSEFQHVGKVRSVHPNGIPSNNEPMLMIAGKSGVVLASHCTLIKRG